MKKYLLLLLCCLYGLFLQAQTPKLRFHNGKFKILQLTDLHWIEDETYRSRDDSTYHLIQNMLQIEHPDLVVLTGDVVVSRNALVAWKKITDLFVNEKTYFAVTFGNHDEETDVNNAQVLNFLRTVPYNLTYDAEKLSGSGNCALPIYSSNENAEKWMLYLFDSHNLVKDYALGYYDWIHHDQIDWYRRTSNEVTARNGRRLPSLAFFHIPLPEYSSVLSYCAPIGTKGEDVCSPSINSGLCAAFLEQKDVIGTFAGHDHNDDYLVDFNGYLALAYGRKTGYPAAYKEILDRGGRVINLRENEAAFDTYILDLKGIHDRYSFEQKNKGTDIPQFNGSFIQRELVAHWDSNRWDMEMKMLKEAGMKYLIYAPALETDEKKTFACYPTSLSKNYDKTLEKCLASAQRNGIKIFIGLNFNERWWKVDYSADWLIDQMKIGNKVADELVALYKKKYPDAMYGWYWVWEVDNVACKTPERQAVLAQALNTNLDHLTKIAPDMPLLLSPFMNEKLGTSDECGKLWQNVFAQTHFRNNDIFAPQDCIGAGGLTLEHLEDWFYKLKMAVNTKPGLKFWSNVETFDQRFWTSAPLSRVKQQLETTNRYVSNFICFAYSHYNSPYVVSNTYHKAYLDYCKEGILPQCDAPQAVQSVSIQKTKQGVLVKWTAEKNDHIAGFSIYYNGALLMRVGVKANEIPSEYLHKTSDTAIGQYEVAAYDAIGNESQKVEAKN